MTFMAQACILHGSINCPMCNPPFQYWSAPTPQPWVCPKCQSVYGPTAHECHRCNPPVSYTVTCIAQGKPAALPCEHQWHGPGSEKYCLKCGVDISATRSE
jgi:hypothetical protein